MALATVSPTGPAQEPSGFFQASPSCLPGVLMIRCAYWFTFESSCFSSAYSCCASTNPRQTAIAFNSLLPMRRLRISSRPTFVSKLHLPLFLTSGIGSSKFVSAHSHNGMIGIVLCHHNLLLCFSFGREVDCPLFVLDWIFGVNNIGAVRSKNLQ